MTPAFVPRRCRGSRIASCTLSSSLTSTSSRLRTPSDGKRIGVVGWDDCAPQICDNTRLGCLPCVRIQLLIAVGTYARAHAWAARAKPAVVEQSVDIFDH